MTKPCEALSKPDSADYDVWQEWMNGVLLQYGRCAARHMKTVEAWPKDAK